MIFILTLIRMYQVPRAFKFKSQFTNVTSQNFCWLNGFHPSMLFITKAAKKIHPLATTGMILIIILFYLGWAEEIIEPNDQLEP
jgi:hypothetical protein